MFDEEQSGASTTANFVFYKHNREIDVELKYENAMGLIGDFYDRYKKNYFFAFPFNFDKPRFYTEMLVGEKNENTEYVPLNANDFSVTQNWVAAENESNGVAIYSMNMNVFHLGNIKYNQFKRDFSGDKGHIYLYASSNRCNNLIYTSPDECNASYRLSILLYNGYHNSIVPFWSNNKNCELIVSKENVLEKRMLKLSCDNVRLVSLKKSEDENAIVLRFIETEGTAVECGVQLFFKPSKATYATNNETDIENITRIDGETVYFNSRPYSYTTIKVYGNFD